MNADLPLRELATFIVAGDAPGVARLLAGSSALATARFQGGATRPAEGSYFLEGIKRQVYAGDTALHIAAAAYQVEIARTLVAAGADVLARNRRGQQALHYAAVGSPGSSTWNPSAQAAMIACLIESGADPSAIDRDGASPLHRAVRTRCAEAVRALLARGADPGGKNKRGSTPMKLAGLNTGRGGTGSPEAKEQQREIVRLLEEHGRSAPCPR